MIYLAAYSGIVELTKELLASSKHDIDLKDSREDTLLIWAAYNGHERMVKLCSTRKPTTLRVDLQQ